MVTDEIMEVIWNMQEEIKNKINKLQHEYPSCRRKRRKIEMAKKLYSEESTGRSFVLPGQITSRQVSCSACEKVIYVQNKNYGRWSATAYGMDSSRYCQFCGVEFCENYKAEAGGNEESRLLEQE